MVLTRGLAVACVRPFPSFFLGILVLLIFVFFFFSSRRRHTRSLCDWSSDVCSSDLLHAVAARGHDRSFDHPLVDHDILGLLGVGRTQVPDEAVGTGASGNGRVAGRSEERRVGKECRARWWP